MVQDMLNEMNLDDRMNEAIRKGGLEGLVKLQMRHCVTHCQSACVLQEQHEQRLVSVEKKLTEAMKSQSGSAAPASFVPKLPKWTYPLIAIGAVLSGLALPFAIVVYLVLVAKGVMPKIW